MYLFTEDILRRKHNRIGDRPYLLEIPAHEAQDIDEEIDFEVAEYLFGIGDDASYLRHRSVGVSFENGSRSLF